MKRFADRVALITGAGSGIGRAVTRRLCAEGASVLAVDIDKIRLDETLGLLEGTVSVFPLTWATRTRARPRWRPAWNASTGWTFSGT
jgi:NAD(P)-dependent dehydrogenase (short-subunit alcohol dehydrogenase family)